MTQEQQKEWHKINTDDYNAMRSMISGIETKLLGVDPIKQRSFYAPLLSLIAEAYKDACDPNDSFLYPKQISQ